VFTPQWPQYLCRWFCLLTLVFAQTTSSASNDYRTRRIGITETGGARAAEGGTLAEPKHTAVVFAGGLSLAEYESASPQTAISNPQTTTVHYTRGPDMGGGVGGLLYTNRGGATKFNLSNGRGDIVAQSDASGALTWTASYEAYGKRTKETGANADKQRANTKDEDPTGLLNEGHRYRDLETGAFISRDPAGFVDGPNLYAYVKQNPWTAFDPEGLEYVPILSAPSCDPSSPMAQACAQACVALLKFIGGYAAGTNPRSQIQYQRNVNPGASDDEVLELARRQTLINESVEGLAAVPHKKGRVETPRPPVATGKGALEKSQVLVNKESGEAWENKIFEARQSMKGNAVRQITIKGNETGKKTKIDVASRDPKTGTPILDEGKASASAPLTPNQKKVIPDIEKNGGVVVGRGKPGFEGGTVIPPTPVNIVRPPPGEKKR